MLVDDRNSTDEDVDVTVISVLSTGPQGGERQGLVSLDLQMSLAAIHTTCKEWTKFVFSSTAIMPNWTGTCNITVHCQQFERRAGYIMWYFQSVWWGSSEPDVAGGAHTTLLNPQLGFNHCNSSILAAKHLVSLTGEIITDDLNGVITRNLATVKLYNTTLIVDPVAGVDTHCQRSMWRQQLQH